MVYMAGPFDDCVTEKEEEEVDKYQNLKRELKMDKNCELSGLKVLSLTCSKSSMIK